MKTLIATLALSTAAALAAPIAFASPKADKTTKAEAPARPDAADAKKLREHMRMRDHIAKHVKYPATKQEVVSACKGMREIKAADKDWLTQTLPDKTYASADDAVRALGWEPTAVPSKTGGGPQ